MVPAHIPRGLGRGSDLLRGLGGGGAGPRSRGNTASSVVLGGQPGIAGVVVVPLGVFGVLYSIRGPSDVRQAASEPALEAL